MYAEEHPEWVKVRDRLRDCSTTGRLEGIRFFLNDMAEDKISLRPHEVRGVLIEYLKAMVLLGLIEPVDDIDNYSVARIYSYLVGLLVYKDEASVFKVRREL